MLFILNGVVVSDVTTSVDRTESDTAFSFGVGFDLAVSDGSSISTSST